MDTIAPEQLAKAREFIAFIKAEAAKRKMNVFAVTDGASGILNNGNPAVRAAREAQIAWEKANGENPDEDWGVSGRKLADTFGKIKYGLAYKDGSLVTNPDDWNKLEAADIVVQSPEELDKSGIGMCHDVTQALHRKLLANNIKHKVYMLRGDHAPDLPTHSFIISEENGKFHVLDPLSYKDHGLFDLTDEKTALSSRLADWKKEGSKGNVSVSEIPEDDWNKRGLLDFLGYQAKKAALGIPDRSDLGDLSALKEDTVATLVRQKHNADRARLHEDMRIGGPSGLYSWAVPKLMPEDGSRHLAIQQPVHQWGYKDFQGRLKRGYGKGTVEKMEESNVVILKNTGDHIMFTRGDVRDAPIYNLVRTRGQNWLLSIYRKDQPTQVKLYPKEHFKQVPMDKVPELIANGATVTKKLDGAGTLLWLGKDGVRAFGIRTNARGQKPEYTDAIGGLRSLQVPKDLQGTLLRGEVIGVRKNKAISPNELSGILNATTMNAAMKRQGDGIKLLVAALAAHENGVDNYDQQRVNDIVARLNSEHVAPMTTYSGDAASKLLKTLQAGGDPMTHEGVVIHQHGKRPLKAKFKDDYDAIIDGIFEADLQPGSKPRAGGFTYTLPGHTGTVGKVGTGFTHRMLVDMLKDPDAYIGRTARVASQEQYPSGALRAPSFISMKEDG